MRPSRPGPDAGPSVEWPSWGLSCMSDTTGEAECGQPAKGCAGQGLTTGRGSSGSSGETSPKWPELGSAAQSSPPAGKARATTGWSGDTSSTVADKDNRTASAGVREGLQELWPAPQARSRGGPCRGDPPASHVGGSEMCTPCACMYRARTQPPVRQRCRSPRLTDGGTYS